MRKISALINPRSGSVPEDAAEQLKSALNEMGEDCDVILLDGDDIVSPIQSCLEADPDLVIVWSGDGTVACALEQLGPDGPPILPLPGGTMNLFHKQIHGGPCEWRDCLERGLKDGREIDIPAGKAGDRSFYVAAMAGNLTDFTGPREALRKGRIMEAIETLSGSDVLDLRTTMSFEVRQADTAPASGHATAVSLFVGTQDSDSLEFAFIDPDNPLELAATGFSALVSDWHEAPGVQTLYTNDVVLTHERGYDLRATLDGEPVRLTSGTRFTRIAKAGRAISANC